MAKKPSSKAKNTADKDASPQDETAEDILPPSDGSDISEDKPTEEINNSSDEDTVDATEPSGKTAEVSETKPELTEPDMTEPDPGEDTVSDDTVSLEDTVTGTEETETAADKAQGMAPATLPATSPQPAKGPGAGSLVLGGIAAGAIGFAAAYFGLMQQTVPRDEALMGDVTDLGQRVDEQSDTIESLAEKVGGITNTDDSALEAQIEALGTLSERVANIENQFEALDARLGDVEQRPVSESADAAAVNAYENELNAAREEIAAQRAELEALIAEAMSTENAADKAASAAMQRAATSRILTALESGSAFAGAVADLETTGIEVPEALNSVAESGVASLSSLQESFPDAARAALAASRDVTGEGTGLTGFLRDQLGARSLEPREGDDPDAVLSRAEAAVRDGRLTDALAEIESLPEEGRTELSDWAGQAAQRLEAMGAAQSLSETLN